LSLWLFAGSADILSAMSAEREKGSDLALGSSGTSAGGTPAVPVSRP
jgi:hypothetical protein